MEWSKILNELGEDRAAYHGAITPPTFQTSNFAFPDVTTFRAAIQDELAHHIYTRGNNPTVQILREKLAALENTEDALVLSSGSSAIAAALMNQVNAGDHVVCVNAPYSWTVKLLNKFLSRFQVRVTYVDGRSIEAIEQAIQSNTKVLFLESPNTMTFELQDLQACGELAKQHGLVSIIDNSYCSPYFQNPANFGIDLVVHSGTKYLNGHSDVVCGVICGSKAHIKSIFEQEYMTLGLIISPTEASMILRGLRTLPLRMEQSNATAQELVKRLQAHPKVKQCYFPFGDDFPQRDLAHRQMRSTGGLFSFLLLADDIQQAETFCNRLTRFLLAASWGGHES